MYFNYRLFLKAEYLVLFRMPFRFKRWAYVFLFTGLYLAFLALVVLGRLLDRIFFPRFRRQPVKEPVFIIAPPRSGTTLLQKLLSRDDQRFVHLKLFQTIFPCICCQRLIGALVWIDSKVGHPLYSLLSWCEKKWFGGWDNLHKMRLNHPEEDDALFLYAFESEAVYLLFPFVHELWEAGYPDTLPAQARKQLMRYYRSCLQRHLYANGPEKTLLSKCTQSCGTVESLLEEFPDAKFITIVRHPNKAIPSHVSLFARVWQVHSPDIRPDGPQAKAYALLGAEWYKHLFAFRHRPAPSNYCCIDYRDLVKNPADTVSKIYEHFGWTVTDSFRLQLEQATQKQHAFKSTHEYSLAQFGLSEAWIQEQLGEIIETYRLEDSTR